MTGNNNMRGQESATSDDRNQKLEMTGINSTRGQELTKMRSSSSTR
jgi:hypothetical protein